jgi:hypothetical protein
LTATGAQYGDFKKRRVEKGRRGQAYERRLAGDGGMYLHTVPRVNFSDKAITDDKSDRRVRNSYRDFTAVGAVSLRRHHHGLGPLKARNVCRHVSLVKMKDGSPFG